MTSASASFTESEVEDAALEWLEGLGWKVAHGPDIAPHAPGAERTDYSEVAPEHRLIDALDRLNPYVPTAALDDGSACSPVPRAPLWKLATVRSTACSSNRQNFCLLAGRSDAGSCGGASAA